MLVRDGKLTVLCHLPPSTIMASPEWVRMGVEQYFNSPSIIEFLSSVNEITQYPKEKEGKVSKLLKSMKMPTPEEYARAIGFCNFSSLRKAIENTDYPEGSRHYLMVGCSVITDMLTRAGLSDRLNAKFVQFVMSAFLGINEKKESFTQSDSRVLIEWGSAPVLKNIQNVVPLPAPDSALLLESPPDPLEMELDRLEKSLPETMQLPVYRMFNTDGQEEDA